MGRVVSALATTLLSAMRSVWHARAEICVTAAVLAGWTLLTWGVASLTVWQVWPLSAGALLLALSGLRLIWTIARDGLYALSRARPAGRRAVPRA